MFRSLFINHVTARPLMILTINDVLFCSVTSLHLIIITDFFYLLFFFYSYKYRFS